MFEVVALNDFSLTLLTIHIPGFNHPYSQNIFGCATVQGRCGQVRTASRSVMYPYPLLLWPWLCSQWFCIVLWKCFLDKDDSLYASDVALWYRCTTMYIYALMLLSRNCYWPLPKAPWQYYEYYDRPKFLDFYLEAKWMTCIHFLNVNMICFQCNQLNEIQPGKQSNIHRNTVNKLTLKSHDKFKEKENP